MNISLEREIRYSRKKRRSLLLAIIMFLSAVTLSTTGFLVGKTVQGIGYYGKLIDTIVLTPGNRLKPAATPTPAVSETFSVTGRILFSDGTPYSNGVVELRSTPRYTRTDAAGYFSFPGVEPGSHTINAIENGTPIASCRVQVEKTPQVSEAQVIRLDNGDYSVKISLKTISVQIELKLSDNDKKMTVTSVKGTVSTTDATGGQGPNIPTGNPGSSPAANTPGAQNRPQSGASPVPGVSAPFTTPSAVSPSAAFPPVPSATPSPAVTPSATPAPSGTPGPQPTSEQSSGGESQTGGTQPSTPQPSSSPIIRAEDNYYGSAKVWTQISQVDIFAPREDTGVKLINGEKVIAPGASGLYLFRLYNPDSSTLRYWLKLSESDYRLPIRYRLLSGISELDKSYVGDDEWKSAEEIEVNGKELSSGEYTYYTLQWKWVSQSNENDTELAKQQTVNYYVINITIDAESN